MRVKGVYKQVANRLVIGIQDQMEERYVNFSRMFNTENISVLHLVVEIMGFKAVFGVPGFLIDPANGNSFCKSFYLCLAMNIEYQYCKWLLAFTHCIVILAILHMIHLNLLLFRHIESIDQNPNLYLHIVGLCRQKWKGVDWSKCL
jgi:hypothetical protein